MAIAPHWSAAALPSDHADDIDICAAEVRRHDHDRYLTALFAPRDRRAALMALYAFNLEIARIRESVSEPLLGEMRLEWWRESIDELFGGTVRSRLVLRALARAVTRHALPRGPFAALIEGRAFDLAASAPANLGALEEYAAATSGSLAELALRALGASDSASLAAGRHAGIAWAINGLVHAVPFHTAARRLYLPRTLCEEAGLDVATLFAGQSTSALRAIIRRLDGVVATQVRAARVARRSASAAARPALLGCALIDEDRQRLRQMEFDPFAVTLTRRPLGRLVRLAACAWSRCYVENILS